MVIHRCKKCNYLYIDDEQKIPFEKVEENYKCPRCHASKKFFLKK